MQNKGGVILNLRRVMSGALLIIFVVYFANISLFSHYHIVDGVTIVHSHFHGEEHTKDPFDSDSHSKNELTLIKTLSDSVSESPSDPFVLSISYIQNYILYNIGVDAQIIPCPNFKISLRGPPTNLV